MLEEERGSGRGQPQRYYGRACTVGEGRLDRPGRIGDTPGKTWGGSRGRALVLERSLSWERLYHGWPHCETWPNLSFCFLPGPG